MSNEAKLDDFAKLTITELKPNDVIVIKTKGRISEQSVVLIKNYVREAIGQITNKVLVLDGGMDMEILREEAKNA